MPQITITSTQEAQVIAALKAFPKMAKIAMRRALNKTAVSGKSNAKNLIHSDFNITKGAISEKIHVKNASSNRLEAQINASGKRLSLIEGRFGVFERRPKGVFVKIKRGGMRSRLPSAFLGRKGGGTGQRTVFVRLGQARLPIRPVTTVSIPYMLRLQTRELEVFLRDKMRKTFFQELNFERSKLVK